LNDDSLLIVDSRLLIDNATGRLAAHDAFNQQSTFINQQRFNDQQS